MDLDSEYSEYKAYIEEFASTIDPHDQLPLRVSGYCLRDFEILGEILDWLNNYLGKSCPITLRMFLIQTAIKRTLEKVKDAPEECGFDELRMVYQPLKLVRIVVGIVNSLIIDLQDNAKLYEVPLPPTSPNASELTKLKQPPKYCVDAIKNSRRTMEDKHMIIDDFNGYFNTQDTEPTFYYGIFDGHSGSDAASYANSHLNYNIAVHPKYPSDIETAMREAFLVTDVSFLKKAKAENLSSGTTALCALYRKTEKKIYVGWCGDSQALIARVGNVRQIVKKHSPEDADERKRIEKLGGVVLFWGNSYRVNGALAVSRAIGDLAHKPFVSAEPEIECINLDGEEDFIVLGCDGLWDSLTEDDVAITVYKKIKDDPNNYRSVASELCSLAKAQGSRDNISVIVVYLKEPHLIATQSWPTVIQQTKDIMENLNAYEEPPVVNNPVTMDALGNTNQDIYNNPFGDFNNQLISDVAMGKSTEITDMVMQQQQQPENNDFCNFTDTLNNINNNKFNNGHDEINFMAQNDHELVSPQQPLEEQSVAMSNDDNNNSNDNFGEPDLGPETDVDAIDEEFQMNAAAAAASVVGEKEKLQMEFKETEEVADVGDYQDSAAIYGNLENKIFEEMSLHNPDLIKGSNPFEAHDLVAPVDNFMQQQDDFMDNKFMEQEFTEKVEDFVTEHSVDLTAQPTGDIEEEDLMMGEGAEHVEEITMHQADADLGFVENQQQSQEQEEPQQQQATAIGESGEEESEDEWNYIKVDKKSPSDALTAVEEREEGIEASNIEQENEEESREILTEPETPEISHQLNQEKPEELEIETEKDFEQEKQPEQEEERQAQDEIEKDLQLSVEVDEEMSTTLNPDAKEFIPISPTRVNGLMSPPINPMLNNIVAEDAVVSQSPRKGEYQAMEDVTVPSELDFDNEADARPHEVDFQRTESPELLNLKESLQQDDKLEQEYKDEAVDILPPSGDDYQVLEKSFSEFSNGFQNVIDDPMNRSFYEGRDNEELLTSTTGEILSATSAGDVLNSVQPIPTFEDEQPEADQEKFNGGSSEWGISADAQEAKYEISQVQTVQETIIVEEQKMEPVEDTLPETFIVDTGKAGHFEEPQVVEEPEVEMKQIEEVNEAPAPEEPVSSPEPAQLPEPVLSPEPVVPEVQEIQQPEQILSPEPVTVQEAVQEPVQEPKVEEVVQKVEEVVQKVEEEIKVEEVIGGGIAVAALAGAFVVATQKPETTKPEAKKADPKAKTAATKANPVPAKRVAATTATKAPAPITKPSSAPIRKAAPASTTAAKPAVSSAATSRPKPSAAPIKKPTAGITAVKDAPKPPPISRTAPAPKKPLTAAAPSTTAAKPSARPTTSVAAAKPRVPSATTTERKPLGSSAPITRAPSKPATTAAAGAAKPKLNGTSSTLSTKSSTTSTTTKTTSTRLLNSATSPTKTLNRSVGSATTATKSPRPATTTTLKSPSGVGSTLTSSVAATKKPLTTMKKSPSATQPVKKTTTTTTVKSPIKKTTTTTTTVVQKKKVVNGDIVKDEITTTQTTSGDPQLIEDILKDAELNGHVNGNGVAENGSGQMVLDSAAD